MSDLENFLVQEKKQEQKLQPYNRPNTCFKCDEYIPSGMIDPDTIEMVWICSNGHESKVKA